MDWQRLAHIQSLLAYMRYFIVLCRACDMIWLHTSARIWDAVLQVSSAFGSAWMIAFVELFILVCVFVWKNRWKGIGLSDRTVWASPTDRLVKARLAKHSSSVQRLATSLPCDFDGFDRIHCVKWTYFFLTLNALIDMRIIQDVNMDWNATARMAKSWYAKWLM